MAYKVDAFEQSAKTQIFLKYSKSAYNVSHKNFHNLQIPSLCAFITCAAASAILEAITRCLLESYDDYCEAT
ncbi:MAG: hypothetical protein QOG55_3345 [Acidobacteriaceae bacterium]|jgi:hypothetical protein|nr:hypothetical protein [Acidobacteriaceae bacterium]